MAVSLHGRLVCMHTISSKCLVCQAERRAADPALPGMMAMRPGPMAAPAFLLDVNEWRRRYDVRLV
jgi:hypothetical protein